MDYQHYGLCPSKLGTAAPANVPHSRDDAGTPDRRAALTRRRRYPRSPCRPLAASKHRRLMSMLASAARLPTAPPPPDRPSSHSAADPAAPAPPPDRTTVHPPSSPDTHRNPPYS